MDPIILQAIAETIGPAVGVLFCGLIPISIYFIKKHFELKTRELELEAELHGRGAQARLQALETRLTATEAALTGLVRVLGPGNGVAMLQPPGASPRKLTPTE